MVDDTPKLYGAKRIAAEDAPGELRDLYALWLRAAGDRRRPARGDIAPWDMRSVIGRVCLLEAAHDPFDLVYRLDGTLIADNNDQDMTGRSVNEIQPPGYAEIVMRELRTSYDADEPVFWRIVIDLPNGGVTYFRCVLPLSSDGAVDAGPPDYLLVAYSGEIERGATASRIIHEETELRRRARR